MTGPNPGGVSGGAFFARPLWLPPIDACWIHTILILFAAAHIERIRALPRMRVFFGPISMFIMLLVTLIFYKMNCMPAAFAMLFFVLMAWATDMVYKTEGYMNASPTLDWVTNSRRWFVERVMKERPVAIQERDVATYPIAGASAQAGTHAGNT